MVSLKEWLDVHEVEINELGYDNVLEACYDAMFDILQDDALEDYVNNFVEDIIDMLEDKLYELSPEEYYKFLDYLKKNGIEEPDKDDEGNELEAFEVISEYRDEFDDYIRDRIDELKKKNWFREFIFESTPFQDYFHDAITPDDYYPLWSYAYEFPTTYRARELNNEMDGMGLIFFELNGVVYVSLCTVGMSLMPSLYYAYYEYSDIDIDPEEIAKEMVKKGPKYWKHVIGEEALIKLAKDIGYDLKELNRISEKNYKEFNELMNILSEKVRSGDMDRLEAGLIGLMKLIEEPELPS